MRLSYQEVHTILKVLHFYDPSGDVFLHGSRIDDEKKGGDIDLFFVVTEALYHQLKMHKFKIVAKLSLELREQKVDLTLLIKGDEEQNEFFLNSDKIRLL